MQISTCTIMAIIVCALSVPMFLYNWAALVEYTYILTCETNFFIIFKVFCYSESERHMAAVGTGLCSYHLFCAVFLFIIALIVLIRCFTTTRRHFHEFAL